MFDITDFSFNFMTGNPFLTGLFFLLFVLFAFYLYRRTNPPLSMGIRLVLTALRIIAVIALFLALFEPVMSFRREFQRNPQLTVLVDKSGSMEIEENNMTRAQRVDSLMAGAAFREFADRFDVQTKAFAGDLEDKDGRLEPDRTALGEVLKKVSENEIGRPAEAWLLFSDGISNTGISPAEISGSLKTPVFTIGVGRKASGKDAAISSIDYNEIVFAGKPTSLTAHLEWQGLSGDNAVIEIKSDNKILSTKSVQLGAGNLRDDFEVKFTPEKPGQQTFQISLSGIADEAAIDNNRRSFSITVLKSKMNVLLVSEKPDWEYAFLKRFLSASESIELSEVIFKKDGGYLKGGFPNRQEEINRYDLIILYDVDINALKSRKPIIESYLNDKGGSLMTILGENYTRSTFPRWLDDFLPFVNRQRNLQLHYSKFNGVPDENYLFHPAVRIADSRQEIREAWNNLPHFEVLVPMDSIAPNTEILVSSELTLGGLNLPLVGVRKFGSGRLLATAALPFWHWAFFGYGFGDDDRQYRMFFDGIVNWLSLKEETDPVRIIPDKNVYTRGEKVGFNALVYDLGFRPIKGAGGYIAVFNEETGDSSLAQLLPGGDGRYRAEFEMIPPGNYRFRGVVRKDGKDLKESTGKIVIESFSIEEYRRQPDFDMLAAVSRQTGGAFYPLSQFDSVYAKINTGRISMATQSEVAIWNKFWLLSIFILALGFEWLIRKRCQLI